MMVLRFPPGLMIIFTNIGPNLMKNIPLSRKNAIDFIPQSVSHSMFLRNTDGNEIFKIVNALKSSSPGYDNITASCLKDNIEEFCPILVHLVNLSLAQGIFPNELKTAKVVPLFKADDRHHSLIIVLYLFYLLFRKFLRK